MTGKAQQIHRKSTKTAKQKNRTKDQNHRQKRLYAAIGIGMAMAAVIGVTLGLQFWRDQDVTVRQVHVETKDPTATSKPKQNPQYPVPIGDPQRLVIPAAGIDAPMGPVSLPEGGGELVPPFDIAAWYTAGPKPGFPGPAVITGHVDSTKGPNVFWNLHKVAVGDEIIVYYRHQKLTFVATETQTSPQHELPTKQIWNETSDQVLRLITCIGTFNHATREYSDNYIVYAKQIATDQQK